MTIDLDRTFSSHAEAPVYRFGPQWNADSSVTFRLWGPSLARAEVLVDGRPALILEPGNDGFLSATMRDIGPGARYRFRTGGKSFPDPASRQQDGDADGWSILRRPIAPSSRTTPLRPWHETIICEVHIGTVTPEGTFDGLRRRLEHFRDAGYTCLEIMPINEFPGRRNWGYDGTLICAPDTAYGTPDELRDLVDRAHELGLCMVLDVVYNHFGETDNFIPAYAPEWFDRKVQTPWGPGINFEQPMVRQFYYENACLWLCEYDFDGLRFDSVHEMRTSSRDLFLGELSKAARTAKSHAKLIIENMDNTAKWLERDAATNEPVNFCAQWNDDIHHVLNYLVTREPKYGYDDPGPPNGLPDPNDEATFQQAKLDWADYSADIAQSALERFRTLSEYRRDRVWPLAATPCMDAKTARYGDGLIVNWHFAGGALSLALNPTDQTIDMPCLIAGHPVSTGSFSQNGDVLRVGAWTAVSWCVGRSA